MSAHTLQLIAGRLTVTFVETPEAVYMGLAGAKALGCERRKLERFLRPLIDAYRDDPRRLEISGEHCKWTGHVRSLAGGWVGYQTLGGPGAMQ